ncbi:unnamed protein product, partial [Strongylus vulgaris]
MESCQMRVDELRLRLDQSLASFQRSSQQKDKTRSLRIVRQNSTETLIEINNIMESCQMRVEELRLRLDQSLASFQRSSQQKDKTRSLRIVRQNSTETLIEINNPGERSRFDRLLATSPLNVICSNGSSPAPNIASSPADSTDSGVAVSPLSSPFGHTKYSPFHQYSSGMRQRSASESGDWDGVVLKSILKKPHRSDRFSRSQSETQHCCGDIASQLSLLMESTTEIDENEEHTENDAELMTEHRKKRVSFSEKVQERRFRVGQCILTAARKNEKKRAYRRRKEERERAHSQESNNENHADSN